MHTQILKLRRGLGVNLANRYAKHGEPGRPRLIYDADRLNG